VVHERCPFCGAGQEWLELCAGFDQSAQQGVGAVNCKNCGAAGPTVTLARRCFDRGGQLAQRGEDRLWDSWDMREEGEDDE